MTQKQLILEYIRTYGSFTPAKMSGVVFMGKMFGSESSRRCRELREEGELLSEPKGRFETYYLPGDDMKTTDQLKEERQQLRQSWLTATLSDRKIIEQRGKLLTWAIEAREKTTPQEKETVLAFEQVFGV